MGTTLGRVGRHQTSVTSHSVVTRTTRQHVVHSIRLSRRCPHAGQNPHQSPAAFTGAGLFRVPAGGGSVHPVADMDALLTGTQAARLVHTYPQRIYAWVERGNLKPAEGDDVPTDGRKYYRYRDVLAAEAATRETVRENGGRRRAIRPRAVAA